MAGRASSNPQGEEPGPLFFETKAAFRRWLAKHHDRETATWISMYRVGSGRPSITWPEVVDVALCFGWIDGIRKAIDDVSYMNGVTPRKPGSNWSAKNINRMHELIAAGEVMPAGLAAFEARRDDRSGVYSFEQAEPATLPQEYEAQLRANRAASAYFDARPPGYRRTTIHWIMSARREDTRRRRLAQLIKDSAAGRPIGLLNRSPRTRPTAL